MEASNIVKMSLNCRGMANKEKRQDIFAKMKDVCLLQDIHWNSDKLILAKEELGYKIIAAPFNTFSRVTAILLNDTFEFNLGKTINDEVNN